MEYRDTATIPAASGAVYNSRCRYQDASHDTVLRADAGESVKAIGYLFFPEPIRLANNLTVKATIGPTNIRSVQSGIIKSFERVGNQVMAVVHFTDVPETTELGTIADLSVLDNGSGSVALMYTTVDGATSYQAQFNGVNEGAAVDDTNAIIVLTGLASGTSSFTVDATNGVTTTTSNSVSFEVS